jgi:hypothetical protein
MYQNGVPMQTTFTYELRSDGSFIYTKDTGLPSYVEGGLGSASVSGTWKTSGSDVILTTNGKQFNKFKRESMDLINPEGVRFLRVR